MTRPAAEPRAEAPDVELAARVARGDVDAFALLYQRYVRPVHALGAHLLGVAEAEEVVQEAFLRLWRGAGGYDPDRGSFRTWFMAVARHVVHAELRRRGRDPFAAVAEVERVLARAVDPAAGVEDAVWQAERGAAVRRALGELPAEQRRVLILAYFGGSSQRTIARRLGWPLGTVKKRTRLALRKMRAILDDGSDLVGAEVEGDRDAPVRRQRATVVTVSADGAER